jgi:hypothetical protein
VLYAGVSSFNVTADEGSLIALTVNGEIIGTAEGTGAPVTITIPGQMPQAQMLVTVTKQNCMRYTAIVNVQPAEGPFVVKESYALNDEQGNSNGLMDYGETILLSLTVENVGVDPAENVSVTLSTTDEYITITDDVEPYGNVAAAAQVTVDDGFAIEVANDIPDGHTVQVEVTATDGTLVWNSSLTIPGHSPVLEFVDFSLDDAGGNGNGKIDPGETVNISVAIENSGSSDALGIEGLLSTADPYLAFSQDPTGFGDLSSGETTSAVFSVTADEETPTGHIVDVVFEMEGALGISGSGSFEVVVGQIPILILDFDGNSNSAPVMEEAIGDMEVAYEIMSAFPPNLDLYATVFVCLGVYPDNHILTTTEGQQLADYLDAGGKLYMEGADTWAYNSPTAVHAMFNIDGVADGSGDLGTINGQTGMLTEGMSFTYAGDNNWIDRLEPLAGAEIIFKNQSPTYGTAIAYDGGTYRTIGASHEFGGLADGAYPSTREALMAGYLSFLGIDASLQALFGSDETAICEGQVVEFVDQSYGNVISRQWTFEGGDPATSSAAAPSVAYDTPGTYDVSLEVSDGLETATMLLEDYITVTGEPSQAAIPEGEGEICTNTVLSSVYATMGADFADTHTWEITPEEAGTIEGTDLEATVTWTADWEGTATIKVKGVNECGEGDFSEALEVLCWVCTGMADLSDESGVSLFPNPSDGTFTIRFNGNFGLTKVLVMNLLSETVYEKSLVTGPGKSLQVDLGEHPEGLYFVKFKNEGAEVVRKMIIR